MSAYRSKLFHCLPCALAVFLMGNLLNHPAIYDRIQIILSQTVREMDDGDGRFVQLFIIFSYNFLYFIHVNAMRAFSILYSSRKARYMYKLTISPI